MRLRTQVLILQLSVITVSLGVGFGVVIAGADDRARAEYADRALAIARSVASDDALRTAVAAQEGTRLDVAALRTAEPATLAAAVRARTGALFVVIANADGIRLAHPEASELGRRVSTDPTRVLSGAEDVTTDRGTLGESVRAKVPVFDDRHRVIGLVSVGISTERVGRQTRRDIATTTLVALAALAVGALGSVLLSRRWRRLTLGLEPDQLAELLREQGAVLHSLADGVLAVDPAGTVRVVNDRARQLLDVTEPVGIAVDRLDLPPRIATVLAEATGEPVTATVGERIVVVSAHRAEADGRDLGTVLSAIDRTDVARLADEVDSIRTMSTALRAQRHETANRFHVLAGLLRHGHDAEALEYLDELIGSGPTGEPVVGLANVDEPHLHAFLEAKAAQARERGVQLTLGDQTWLQGYSLTDPATATTVIGNLVDNALDAALDAATDAATDTATSGRDPVVQVELITDDDTLVVTVADSGDGIGLADPQSVFEDGVTTKDVGDPVTGGRGLGLAIARRVARRVGGDIVIADPGGSHGSGAVLVARLPGMLEVLP